MSSNFEGNLFSLIGLLYKIDDCVDGLEFIIDKSTEDPFKHQKIFKECYQMSLCYLEELRSRLEDLLKFPVHLFMDVKLAEIVHKFSQEQMPLFVRFIQNTPSSLGVSTAGAALNQYKNLEIELKKAYQFIYRIKERLKELYFRTTNVHLLTQPTDLYKRHAVLKLFS